LSSKYSTYVIRGTLYWAKVLGAPIMNDYAKARQWSVDVTPDDNGLKTLKTLKLTSKLKESKNPEQGKFISFRQNEFKKSGEPNDPITITDIKGNPWPSNKKLGNGTVADVKFSYIDFGTTKGNYITAIRVLKHVPYVQKEFDDLSEDDEFFAETDAGEAADYEGAPTHGGEDLDDDVPF
jgi:hypothetical protein